MVGKKGKVIGLERIENLVSIGQNNIKQFSEFPILIKKASLTLGLLDHIFDRILVSAAATKIPISLLNQLTVNGCCVIPINDEIYVIKKIDLKNYETHILKGFKFVPLIYSDLT